MDSTQHPLQNHLIVTNVVKFLKFKELKKFRLVSKVWNSSSKQCFQQKSCVSFHGDDGRTRIRKYLESNVDIFINFKFVKLNICGKYKRIVQIFTESYGPLIKEIAFIKCIASIGIYGEILNELQALSVLSIAFPASYEDSDVENNNFTDNAVAVTKIEKNLNLRFLEVTGCMNDSDDNFTPWESLIEAFPNIEVLGCQCRTSEDLTQFLSLLSMSPCLVKNLSDFSCVLTDLHNAHVEMLLKVDCNLVNLDLSLADNIDSSLVTLLIKRHSKTLRSVKFFRDSESSCTILDKNFTDVSFNYLTSLEIQCNTVNSLDFLKLIPNLKYLNLLQYGDGDVTFNNILIRNTDPKLEFPCLRSFSYEYFLAQDCMEKIALLFPNMSRLSSYLTDDNIRIIFRDMKELQEIIVLGTQVSDEGITGVPLNLLERKYKFMKDYRKLPYIGDLKSIFQLIEKYLLMLKCCTHLIELWRFVLYPQPQEKITDFSVTYGFMDAINLTCIEIPETAISNTGIATLQTKKNLVTLTSPFYARDGEVFSRPGVLQALI